MIGEADNQKHGSTSVAWTVTCACVLLLSSGCRSWLPLNKSVRRIDPAMSMSIDRDTLVQRLNQQSAGLNGWQSFSTKLTVRMPKFPTQRLSGAIACEAPNYFRLMAGNVIAKADLGSNASKCWAYVHPGDGELLTWNHEDTDLVQQLPLEIPFIDPNWLMLVLGITPLDASEYQLGPAPNSKPELWLTAMEQSPQGRMLKRVIKVDTLEGVIREHALYDDCNQTVVRAVLGSHQPHAGYLVPEQVRLIFPTMKTELTLAFKDVETNPAITDELWHMPEKNVKIVDLGLIARQHLLASEPRRVTAQRTAERHRYQEPRKSGFEDPSREVIHQSSYEQPSAENHPAPHQKFATFEDYMRSEESNGQSQAADFSENPFSMAEEAPDFDDSMPPPDWDQAEAEASPKRGFFGF